MNAHGRRAALVAGAGSLLSLAATGVRAQAADEFGRTALRAAGSTFAHPLMADWAREYRKHRQGGGASLPMAGGGLDDDIGGTPLDYEAVGSMAGIQRVRAGAVDLALSEMPLGAADLRSAGLRQVPLAAGAVAVAANLSATATLRLDGPLLADIYLGRVKTWSDPALARLNPGVRLPDAPIAVLHRGDGSGTTYTFTDFLSRTSADWKTRVGSDLLVNWPLGQAHKGSSGLVAALQRTPNAIGYVNLQQTEGTRLVIAAVAAAGTGRPVAPGAASVQAAVAAAPWDAAQAFATPLVDIRAEGAYPIVAAVYAILPGRSAGARAERARGFVEWALTQGRTGAQRLGYVALPPAVVGQALAALRA